MTTRRALLAAFAMVIAALALAGLVADARTTSTEIRPAPATGEPRTADATSSQHGTPIRIRDGGSQVLAHGYDSPSDLARTNTRLDGYRWAPQTSAGPNGALRDVATGRFASNPSRVAPSPASGIHGNSLASTRPTTLCQLTDAETGVHLKWGITSEANPIARYTAAELQGRILNPIQVGSRADMAALERWLVERAPGPMNLEPWAGTVRESIFGGLLP